MSLNSESAALLQTYAPLGVAFAGFAGVIGAFSRFRIRPEAAAFRIRAMVTVGAYIVLFALLPMTLSAFGMAEPSVWRVADGVVAVASGGLLAVLWRQVQTLYAQGFLKTQSATWILSGAGAALIVALLAAAFGIVSASYASSLYLALLFFGMILCAYYFFMMMMAVRLHDGE